MENAFISSLLQVVCKFNRFIRLALLAALSLAIVLASQTRSVSEPVHYDPEFHALVIGIDAYERSRRVPGARRDADAIAARLSALGFTLFRGQALHNLPRAALLTALRDFASRVPEGARVVVYWAGHGVAYAGNSYLLPPDDDQINGRDDLDAHAVALRTLTARLAARPGVQSLLLIDACRANGLRRADGPGLSGAGGSGDLVASASSTMHLIYAAAPGQVAADTLAGEDHGPFAAALLSVWADRNQPSSALFRALSVEMARIQDNQIPLPQTPWMISSLGSFPHSSDVGQ